MSAIWLRYVAGLVLLALPAARAADRPAGAAPDAQPTDSVEEAIRSGWPMGTGPYGNLLPARCGSKIVSDLNLARVVWVSKEGQLGCVRIGRNPDGRLLPGSVSSPIVAGGMVFITTFRPSGDAISAKGQSFAPELQGAFRILADDVLVAIDATTGRTAWEAVEPGGVSRPGGKRTSYGPAAAYLDGTVFSLGTTGRLFAYDAKTGAKKWESNVGAGQKSAVAARDKAVAAKKEIDHGSWVLSSLVVVPGTVIANDFRGGLTGFDPVTGNRTWNAAGVSSGLTTPIVARPDGKPVLLAHNGKDTLSCLDPADGRTAWSVDGLGPLMATLAASDRTVLVNIRPHEGRKKDTAGRWGAYRFTARGAKLAWSLPDSPEYDFAWWFDAGARRKGIIRDGVVFLTEVGAAPHRFLMIREQDGRVILDAKGGADAAQMGCKLPYRGTPRLIEDRLLVAADEAHGPTKTPVAFDHWRIKPDGLELLSKNWDPTIEPATGYEVLLDWPYVDGRLYSRTINGAIACYDLRKLGNYTRLDLQLTNGFHGLTAVSLPLRLYFAALVSER